MECPYCAEEIKDQALVCKHCRHDFFAMRPLMQQVEQLKKRVEELETALAAAPAAGPAIADSEPKALLQFSIPTLPRALAVAGTFALLMLAHYIIIVRFDLSMLYLRIVSIVVPMIFGFLYQEHARRYLSYAFLAGAVTSVVTILCMSAVIGRIDNTPILPHDPAGWREFAEYSASITFGFFTGVLVRQSLLAVQSPVLMSNQLIRMITRYIQVKIGLAAKGKAGKEDIDNAKKIEAAIATAISVGTAVISAVTGLRQFLG